MFTEEFPEKADVEARVKQAFSKVLRDRRKKYRGEKMTQERLAYESGYDRTYLYKLENAKHQPSLTTFLILAHHLQISPVTLFRDVIKEMEINEQ